MARMNLARKKLFSAQSLAANFTSLITDVNWLHGLSVTLETAGVTSNTGTFTLEFRNTVSDDPNDQSSWRVYPGLTSTLADTNAEITFRVTDILESEVRISFVAAGVGPNGTVTAFLNARQKGG